MTPLAYSSISELRQQLKSGHLSAQDLWQDCVKQHQRWHDTLNAYHLWDEELLLSAPPVVGASKPESDYQLGDIPFSVKSVIAVDGYPLFAGGSAALPDGLFPQGDVINKIRQQGGRVSGITHAAEFAVGGLGANEHWPIPCNPWDAEEQRVPGGSSSGAAISVWEGSCVFAIGTDTGGSVRVPASASGLAGLKTTSGRWSTNGVVPLAKRFDSIGLIAHRVEDLVHVFNTVDSSDSCDLQGCKLDDFIVRRAAQVCWQDLDSGIAEAIEQAIEELCKAGMSLRSESSTVHQHAASLRDNSKPNTAAIELGALFANELSGSTQHIGQHVRDFVRSEAHRSEAEHQQRVAEVEEFQQQVSSMQQPNEITLMPTLKYTPPTVASINDADIYKRYSDCLLHNTVLASMAKQCAVTLPVGLDTKGMPVGLQIVAPSGHDAALLRFSVAAERVLGPALERLGLPPRLRT